MDTRPDWIIHYVFDVPGPYPYLGNAHTHGNSINGMEKYKHLDFQTVINFPQKHICYLLNTMGMRVQGGETFHDGDMVSGIYEDCDVRLKKVRETGRDVLRLIIPNKYNRLDACINNEHGTIYSIEMQCSGEGELPRKSRFFQCNIDSSLISHGENYAKLKESFIRIRIFYLRSSARLIKKKVLQHMALTCRRSGNCFPQTCRRLLQMKKALTICFCWKMALKS